MSLILKKYIFLFFLIMFSSWDVIADNAINTLMNEGYVYSYEKIPVYMKGTKKLMFYKGKISVLDPSGINVFLSDSDYSPGCEGEISPISIINVNMNDLSVLGKSHTKKIIVFCGSISGRHNTIRLFQPKVGFVSFLDFLDGPVKLNIDSDGVYSAEVYYKFYMKSLKLMINFPVYYRLKSIGGAIAFSSELNLFSENFYRQYIYRKTIPAGQSPTIVVNRVQALIAADQIQDIKLYCDIFRELNDSNDLKKILAIKNELKNRLVNNKYKCER